MLYSDFSFWLYGQPIETQIIVMKIGLQKEQKIRE